MRILFAVYCSLFLFYIFSNERNATATRDILPYSLRPNYTDCCCCCCSFCWCERMYQDMNWTNRRAKLSLPVTFIVVLVWTDDPPATSERVSVGRSVSLAQRELFRLCESWFTIYLPFIVVQTNRWRKEGRTEANSSFCGKLIETFLIKHRNIDSKIYKAKVLLSSLMLLRCGIFPSRDQYVCLEQKEEGYNGRTEGQTDKLTLKLLPCVFIACRCCWRANSTIHYWWRPTMSHRMGEFRCDCHIKRISSQHGELFKIILIFSCNINFIDEREGQVYAISPPTNLISFTWTLWNVSLSFNQFSSDSFQRIKMKRFAWRINYPSPPSSLFNNPDLKCGH